MWDIVGSEHFTSYEFTLEYQKGLDNAATDVLSEVPVRHDKDNCRSLLEGVVTGTTKRGEVLISQPLQVEHDCLSEESQAPCPQVGTHACDQLGRGTG